MKQQMITIKLLSWLGEKAAKGAAGTLEVKLILNKGDTVSHILQRLEEDMPLLSGIITDPDHHMLQPDIGLIINDRLFDLAGGYDALLKEGDILLIFPAFSEG